MRAISRHVSSPVRLGATRRPATTGAGSPSGNTTRRRVTGRPGPQPTEVALLPFVQRQRGLHSTKVEHESRLKLALRGDANVSSLFQRGGKYVKDLLETNRKAALSMSPNHAQTAVILDEHPLWLEAVEGVLHRIGIRVTGKATSPAQALTLVEEASPDLLVADLPQSSGAIDGATFLAKARQLVPHLRTIVLSSHTDPSHIDAALEAGAAAYVAKTTHPDDLASAVRQSFNHSVYLAAGARAPAPAVSPATSSESKVRLTRREHEILRLVAEGHSNAQLARMLWVTEQTVKFHLSNIYRKLHVSNRTEASRWAQLNGLLPKADAGEQPSAA
jgi:two-component system response regulator DevR